MLIDLFESSVGSTAMVVLGLAYLLVESVTVYDMRFIQARSGRYVSAVATAAHGLSLPSWIGHVYLVGWLLLISVVVLNWRFAVTLYLLGYALRILPVLERIGEGLMRPFLTPDYDAALREGQEKLAENQAELARARQDWEEAVHLMGPGSTVADFVPAFRTWWLRQENQRASLGDALERYVDEYNLYEKGDADEPHPVTLARSILKVLDGADVSFEGEDASLLLQYTASLKMRIGAYEAKRGIR